MRCKDSMNIHKVGIGTPGTSEIKARISSDDPSSPKRAQEIANVGVTVLCILEAASDTIFLQLLLYWDRNHPV